MANEEHLKILKQGKDAWNQWRKVNPNLVPDLSGADLSDADLNNLNLSSANFVDANLSHTNLHGSDLSNSNLTNAQLHGTDLAHVNLRHANFSNALLSWVNFLGTSLEGTIFTDATLGCYYVCNVDLSECEGLETVKHSGPSSIGIDTLSHTLRGSGGRFTQEELIFFEESGVPFTLLEYLPDLLETDPLQFYDCFISYCTEDETFAELLNQDLTDAGIKTWKWDRDAVRGRDLWQNIDHAFRTYHKTILVCSANSLASPQVEREIQQALDKEARIKNANSERRKEALSKDEKLPTVDADVLIPIRLDDTIFNWDSHLKGEVTRRMVADFTEAPPGSDKYNRELELLKKALNPKSWPPAVARLSK